MRSPRLARCHAVAAPAVQSAVVRSSMKRSRSRDELNVTYSSVSPARSQSAAAVGAMRQSYRARLLSSAPGERKVVGAQVSPDFAPVRAMSESTSAFAFADHAAGIGWSAMSSLLLPPPHAARPTASSVTSASVVVRILRTVPPGIVGCGPGA